MRRADRARAEHHAETRAQQHLHAVAPHQHADRAPVLHHDAQRHRVADHGQVRPRQRRHQVRARGRDTPLPAPRLLEGGESLAPRAVHVGVDGQADRLRRGGEFAQQRGRLGQVLDRLRAGRATPLAAAGEILVPHEVRQQVVPPPARAALLRPEVVVGRMAAHMPQPIDRRRPTPHPPAGIIERTPARRRIGLGPEPPGQPRMIENARIARRDMDIGMPVTPAGLDDRHTGTPIRRKPVRQHTAGTAGTDDDMVEGLVHARHGSAPGGGGPGRGGLCPPRTPPTKGLRPLEPST